jgi:hypothetical protein
MFFMSCIEAASSLSDVPLITCAASDSIYTVFFILFVDFPVAICRLYVALK